MLGLRDAFLTGLGERLANLVCAPGERMRSIWCVKRLEEAFGVGAKTFERGYVRSVLLLLVLGTQYSPLELRNHVAYELSEESFHEASRGS